MPARCNQLATDFTVKTDGTAMQISSEPIPTSAVELNANPGKLYINVSNIELSVCYVSPSGSSYIPRSWPGVQLCRLHEVR